MKNLCKRHRRRLLDPVFGLPEGGLGPSITRFGRPHPEDVLGLPCAFSPSFALPLLFAPVAAVIR